jgi:hypothetical protein
VTPAETLSMADRLLDRTDAATAGLWPRAAALLARQALEEALDERWRKKGPALDRVTTLCQLICLQEYLDDEALAASVRQTWVELSEACHHHPYELAPTMAELRRWIAVTESLLETLV